MLAGKDSGLVRQGQTGSMTMMSRTRYFWSVSVRAYLYQAMTWGVSSHGVRLVGLVWAAVTGQRFFPRLFVPRL